MKLKVRKSFLIALVLAILVYIFSPGYLRLEKTKETLDYYRERNEELRRENSKLKKEIWALKNDPLYVEGIARKELGYGREGEVIYEIEKNENSPER